MPRSAADIQSEIDVIEAVLSGDFHKAKSIGNDGFSLSRHTPKELGDRLNQLYRDLDRANNKGPLARPRIQGAGRFF